MVKAGSVDIVVLNWNGRRDTLACLRSLSKVDYPTFRIVVVDNGSTDGSAFDIGAQHPECILIENNENLGYSGGNNVGIEWSLTGINNTAEYWSGACGTPDNSSCGSYIEDNAQPKSVLTTGQVHIRKGLPFSFEMISSEVWPAGRRAPRASGGWTRRRRSSWWSAAPTSPTRTAGCLTTSAA